ncbi:MAG: efflux RND transporter permease subunit [Pyrinomonadaceae bacterium MAG19_C2-C3]|nr:efflux RND transporter permease subunit [Pyrinomonadaceae bacterium MAG19_C2-C3]
MQKLAELCVRRPVFATVLILVLTVVGGFAFFTLGVDRFPRIDLPVVSVSTSNPGAAPQEIETEITDIIEGAVNTVTGIDELRSTSSQGRSSVNITFNLDKDPDLATQEVRDKVSTVLSDLPETADPPIVRKQDPDSAPVILYSISAPLSSVELTNIADKQIREKIESVDGVGEVVIYGERLREIQIFVDPERLRAYNLSITEVSTAVSAQNLESPGGSINEGAKSIALRTLSKVENVEDFGDILVAERNGYQVRVRDIGRVVDGGVEPTSAVSLNGNPAVSVAVRKQSGVNTIEVIKGVKARMAEIIPTLPKDMVVIVTRDQSEFIETSLHAIEEHLVVGGLLAAVIVFLFLWNVRSTIIAALAIPVSIIAAFAAIAAFGYTLNQMTMLALTLMVGIVIDDAIVVLENIYRFVEEKGMHPFQAAVEGTKEIGLAVLATTLSLVAVFLPVGFMGGIVGRFMSSFGLTSTAAILVSLLVSFTLTPMLAARWIKPKKPEPQTDDEQNEPGSPARHKTSSSKDSRFYRPIEQGYVWLLKLSMAHRWAVVIICIVVVASIYPLYSIVGINFVPEEDESAFTVNLRAPIGTSLAATNTVLDRAARDIREKIPGVVSTLSIAGFGGTRAGNSGVIFVRLVPPGEREQAQPELIQQTRAVLREFPKQYRLSASAESSIGRSIGGGRAASIGFFISGPDIKKLDEYSNQIVERIREDENIRDADTSLELGSPEVRVRIDRQRAADLGVRAGDVSRALSFLVAGQRISTFNDGTDQYDVLLRADERFRRDVNDVSGFLVQSSTGGTVDLSSVVSLEEGTAPASVERLDRERQVTIRANIAPEGSETAALETLNAAARAINMDAGYFTGVTGQSKELGRANYYFMLAFALSFIFMYLILAAQFESFIHPVTILLTLPLAVPFALLSTLIAGQRLNIFSALGILLLFGIVKKNAILQIDHTNQLRARGMERYTAIIQANRDRLRPILMTTIALVAGMIPLILGSGAGAATNRSIGVLVVGGQSMCLLLTLLAVPVFYSLFEDARESRVWGWIGARTEKAQTATRTRLSEGWATLSHAFTRHKPTDKTDKPRYVDQAGD